LSAVDDSQARKFQKELNVGLVALVVLAVLDRSSGDLYGYDIAKRLQRANAGEPLFKEGTVYPVLRSLLAGGFLTSRVEPSSAGPPRRYYRITRAGRAAGRAEAARLEALAQMARDKRWLPRSR